MTVHYEVWIKEKKIPIESVVRVEQTKEDITFFDENNEIVAFFRREFVKGIVRIEVQDEGSTTEMKFEPSNPLGKIHERSLNRGGANPPIEVEFAKESEPSNLFQMDPSPAEITVSSEPKPYLGYMLESLQQQDEIEKLSQM